VHPYLANPRVLHIRQTPAASLTGSKNRVAIRGTFFEVYTGNRLRAKKRTFETPVVCRRRLSMKVSDVVFFEWRGHPRTECNGQLVGYEGITNENQR